MQQINLTINQTTPSMILYKEHSIAVNIPYQTEINHYLSHPPLSDNCSALSLSKKATFSAFEAAS